MGMSPLEFICIHLIVFFVMAGCVFVCKEAGIFNGNEITR